MFRFRPFSNAVSQNHFFCNRALQSLRSTKPLAQSKVNYLRSNTQILQSSFGANLFQTFKASTSKQLQQTRAYARSETWNNYNKYYKRTSWDRLKRPALFTALFCIGTTVVTPYLFEYPPFNYLKRNPYYLVYGLIAVNGLVFLGWRVPQLSRYWAKYAIIMKDNLQSNLSLLGSAFSHQSFGHFLVNMFVLHSFGTSLCAMVGVANFTVLYLNSAVISSFISIAIPTLLRTSLSGVASLGASGAVFSVFGAFSYLIPKAPIALFFIPVPGGAWVLFLGSVAYNIAGSVLRWGKYDYAAHIGGSIAGVAYGWWFNKKRKDAATKRRLRYGL